MTIPFAVAADFGAAEGNASGGRKRSAGSCEQHGLGVGKARFWVQGDSGACVPRVDKREVKGVRSAIHYGIAVDAAVGWKPRQGHQSPVTRKVTPSWRHCKPERLRVY